MTQREPVLPLLVPVPGLVRQVRRRAAGRDRDHQLPGRSRQLKLRVSHDEYSAIAGAARDAGLTPTGYAAEAALAAAAGDDPPSQAPWRTALAELIEARTQVRRIGTNINQAARILNADGGPPVWLENALAISGRALGRLDDSAAALQALARHQRGNT